MHLIVGILIGIVFTILLTKAIIETVWGASLIAFGTGCKLLAGILRILAKIIRLFEKTRHCNEVVEETPRLSIANGFARAHSLRSEQTDRLSQAHQNRKSKACLKQH